MTNNIDYFLTKQKLSLRDFSCSSMLAFLCKGSFEITETRLKLCQISYYGYTKISLISVYRRDLLHIKIGTNLWGDPELTLLLIIKRQIIWGILSL